MILADTTVVSELMKEHPDPGVTTWVRTLAPDEVCICAITVEEIERSLAALPAGRRKAGLEQRWRALLQLHTERIKAYDVAAAQATARLTVDRVRAGRPIMPADAQIAGICLAAGAVLATRNVKDFEALDGLEVLDPFDSAPS